MKKKRFNKKRTIELANIWVENPTPQNAENVILAMDELCWWLVNKRKKITDNTRISADDLHQEARMGVWRAMQKYNSDKGCFVSYSAWWIKQAIHRHITNEIHIVKFPRRSDDWKVYAKYNVVSQEIYDEMGAISISELHEEITKRTGIRAETLAAYHDKRHECRSIDGPVRGNGGDSDKLKLANILTNEPDYESDLNRTLDCIVIKSHIEELLQHHNARDRDIIKKHMKGGKMTDGARKYGISRQRVEQIVSSAKEDIMIECLAHFAPQ